MCLLCYFRSPSPKRKRKERSPTPKPLRIHVGRLTRNVTKDHISEIFSSYGVVKFVEFPMDRFHPPAGRGYAYVEFESADQAENAMKHMDGGEKFSIICGFHHLNLSCLLCKQRCIENLRNVGSEQHKYCCCCNVISLYCLPRVQT